jgi:hypothetical protein
MGLDIRDPNDVFSYGMAIADFGICQVEAVNGFGLCTRGFLWQAHAIWASVDGIGISTSWSLEVSAAFGEVPPQLTWP